MARVTAHKTRNSPVGSVAVQQRGGRAVLLVQETSEKVSVIESWEDAFDLIARLLNRIKGTLNEMNLELSAYNRRSAVDLRRTRAKIAANQRLLDKIVKAGS
jgi:hypothetical protein